jgi:AcrR family transcriptional regulator
VRVSPRQIEIVAAARAIVEADGGEALTMQRLADALGIRAPSLYKHFPDKATVEAAVTVEALGEQADVLEGAGADLQALGSAYRGWATTNPHLHRFLNARPLPRERLPPGLEQRAAAPLLAASGGDLDLARAGWGALNGLVDLELAGRFPEGAQLDGAYAAAVRALKLAVETR